MAFVGGTRNTFLVKTTDKEKGRDDPSHTAASSQSSEYRLLTWCRDICLELPDVAVDSPFGPDSETFRLHRKIFALLIRSSPVCEFALLNLKAGPEEIPLLVQAHDFILPGYHMNKKHWISVALCPEVDRAFVEELIEDSYDYVMSGLPLRLRTPRADR